MTTEWTKCSERMPKNRDSMLVTTLWPDGARFVETAYLRPDGWYYTYSHAPVTPEIVIAWMPLPEPFAEDK